MELPLIEGAIIRLTGEHLLGRGKIEPVRLSWSGTGVDADRRRPALASSSPVRDDGRLSRT
ncbi:hypothetical protein [Nonomuraea sp. KM90]|uniref:hypothetical protein n=1 Tax=Nonomuraea sp. KM90 TaxID=3457428 RepID=UPI003FCCC101